MDINVISPQEKPWSWAHRQGEILFTAIAQFAIKHDVKLKV